MEQIRFGRWVVECDPEATRRAYDAIEAGGAESCRCSYCRNFVAQRDSIFPSQVLDLFERLGIDYTKEAEVWEASMEGATRRFYSGWFHFIGNVVSSEELDGEPTQFMRDNGLGEDWEPAGDAFAVKIHTDAGLVPQPFEGYRVLQLEFTVELPWVLDEPPP